MPYQILIDGHQVNADSVQDVVQLLGAMKKTNQKVLPKITNEDLKGVSKDLAENKKRKQKRKFCPEWPAEHIQFLADNLENKSALKTLPYTVSAIASRLWVFRHNKINKISKVGQQVLIEYNKKIGRETPREYLPKI